MTINSSSDVCASKLNLLCLDVVCDDGSRIWDIRQIAYLISFVSRKENNTNDKGGQFKNSPGYLESIVLIRNDSSDVSCDGMIVCRFVSAAVGNPAANKHRRAVNPRVLIKASECQRTRRSP